MVEANPSMPTGAASSGVNAPATTNGTGANAEPQLIVSTGNFIHMNEGNIKAFYKISSCIGRGKC